MPARTSNNFFVRAFYLYYDGFRSMTVGRTLWVIIFIKLFIFFIILKFIFFPDFLSTQSKTDAGKAEYVRTQLINRK
jgi:hypothetical protein